MDVGAAKAEHGGVHEALMGAGGCLGPAVGAAGLLFWPQISNASAYAVTGLLAVGLIGLVGLRFRRIRGAKGV